MCGIDKTFAPMGIVVILLASAAAIGAGAWFFCIDGSQLVPHACGTAVTLPGGYILGQNRRVLFDSNTGVCHCPNVVQYEVVGSLIIVKGEDEWVLINWRMRSVEKYTSAEKFAERLRELGVSSISKSMSRR
jgi:hypothetical protein